MKFCPKCKTEKDESEFSRKTSSSDGLAYCCKTCHNQYVQNHYRNNPEYYKDKAGKRNKQLRKDNLRKSFEYLLSHPCVDCGETDITVLEFDHVTDNKSYNIAEMFGNKRWEQIEEEISKCEVRCANCHRKVTAKRGNYYVIEYLASIA